MSLAFALNFSYPEINIRYGYLGRVSRVGSLRHSLSEKRQRSLKTSLRNKHLTDLWFAEQHFFKNKIANTSHKMLKHVEPFYKLFSKKPIKASNSKKTVFKNWSLVRQFFFFSLRNKHFGKFSYKLKKKLNFDSILKLQKFLPTYYLSAKTSLIFNAIIKRVFIKPITKRPIKLKSRSAFSKNWQKFFSKRFFKNLSVFSSDFVQSGKQAFNKLDPKGFRSTNYFQTILSNPFSKVSLLQFLQMFWFGAPASFCIRLIRSGFCLVNGEVIFELTKTLKPFDYISFTSPGFALLIVRLAISKLAMSQNSQFFNRSKIKQFNLDGFAETSQKNGEILLLEQNKKIYSFFNDGFPLDFTTLKINDFEILRQRFFDKQKKFGLGRLL